MVLYIDFDRTICDPDNVQPGYRMGPPMPGAIEAMQHLAPNNTLVIFTVRAYSEQSTKVVADWLQYFNIPYHKITNIKGDADVYLDDKGVHFTGWQDFLDIMRNNLYN